MSAPYWGQLPAPKVSTAQVKAARRLSGESSPTGPGRHSLDGSTSGQPQPSSRMNRISVQTTNTEAPTESTQSPYASPTASSFVGHGLAPRPATLPYGQSQYPPELLEKRQRRRSRRSEEYEALSSSPVPPTAPDVPKAPPVSYRGPQGNGSAPYAHTAAGASRPPAPRQALPPVDAAAMEPEEYYKESAATARRSREYPPLDRAQKSLDAGSSRSRRGVSEGEPVRQGSTRTRDRDRVASAEAGHSRRESGRRKFADDRSPLQRLELTLDSITKEEKRARVQAAEDRARERSSAKDAQQVRFRETRSVATQLPETSDPSIAAARRAEDGKGPLSQNPPEEGRTYGNAPAPAAKQTKSSIPQRNLSFRERAARSSDLKLPNSLEPASPAASPPQTTPPGGLGGISLTRSGSNKLKKDPPGDPWYLRRAEAEKKFGSVSKRTPDDDLVVPSGAVVPRAPVAAASVRDKALPPVPAPAETRKPTGNMNKAAKLLGAEELGGIARRVTEPTPRRRPDPDEYDEDELNQPGYATPPMRAVAPPAKAGMAAARRRQDREDDSDSDSEAEGERRHRISNMVFRARDQLKPGEGMYKPPRFLDEWRKGTVGTLSGALLDLSEEQLPGVDKDKAWWEANGRRRGSISSRPRKAEAFDGEYDETNAPTRFKPALYLECGPLLRYCGMRHEKIPSRSSRNGAISEREIWRGTVMIVTKDADSSYDIAPTLRLFVQPIDLLPPPPAEIQSEEALSPEFVDPIAGHPRLGRRGETLYVRPVEHLEEAKDLSMKPVDEGLFETTKSPPDYSLPDGATDLPGSFASRRKRVDIDGEKVSKYKDVRGFRLHVERGYTFWRFNIEVELREKQQRIAYRINRGPATGFWVPARGQTMNVMFYSCNGFSRGTDTDELSGPDPMWRDVLNTHQSQPFHVMLGGGDQIYNDVVIDGCPLFRRWAEIRNPLHKHNQPFTQEMQNELETFYLRRYCMWFSQGFYGMANSQIPMVNMFDDHDIFDGYGSYPYHDMNSPVFTGLGAVAFKYYMLFQHQSVMDETESSEPSWVLGEHPGPFINELSRSLFMFLGSRMALVVVDARTERTEYDVMRNGTWQRVLDRLYAEITKGKVDHLLVLLGVPIAYPRLVWLENILTSRLLDPVKALGKLGLLGNALNHIDGGVEVLDDLNDHWTAKNHKKERQVIIEDLQDFAAERSCRVTILSGDVHLAAVGQFYSNPKLGLPKHKDFRYMPNVISSAIVNAPPPDLLADVLNKRNKVHHFDTDTDESMIPMFPQGVEGKPRNNKHMLPHRNWCSIRAWTPGMTPPPTPPLSAWDQSPSPPASGGILRRLSKTRPSQKAAGPREPRDSRPPISNSGGLFRTFSRRRSEDSERPAPPKRSLSLTRADFNPLRLFNRRASQSHNPDDGGINGQWGYESEEEQFEPHTPPTPQRAPPSRGRVPPPHQDMRLRGGGAHDEYYSGDESYFTAQPIRAQRAVGARVVTAPPVAPAVQPPTAASDEPIIKPFHRTPTGLSTKQKKNAADYQVNLEGGLDICLNVEVNAKDPAGITVPYRLLVPKLFYDYTGEDAIVKEESGFKKLLSFRRKNPQQATQQGPQFVTGVNGDEEMETPGSAGIGR